MRILNLAILGYVSFLGSVVSQCIPDDPFGPRGTERSRDYSIEMKRCVREFRGICEKLGDDDMILIERRIGSLDREPAGVADSAAVTGKLMKSLGEELGAAGDVAEGSESEVFCELLLPNNKSKYRYYLIIPALVDGEISRDQGVVRIVGDDGDEIDVKIRYGRESAYVKILAVVVGKFKNMKCYEEAIRVSLGDPKK